MAAAAAVLLVVVAAHVGLVGAILDSAWTGWTVAAVVVVVLAKLTVVRGISPRHHRDLHDQRQV